MNNYMLKSIPIVTLFVFLTFSIAIQLILPFPYGLIISLAFFIIIPLIMKRTVMKQLRMFEGRVTKTCLICGKKCKSRQCNRCGSHQFRMG